MSKFFESNSGVVERHQRYFLDFIQSSVDNLADIDGALKPWLETVARAHTGFAIKPKHWDACSEAILSTINEWINGPSQNRRETIRSVLFIKSFWF